MTRAEQALLQIALVHYAWVIKRCSPKAPGAASCQAGSRDRSEPFCCSQGTNPAREGGVSAETAPGAAGKEHQPGQGKGDWQGNIWAGEWKQRSGAHTHLPCCKDQASPCCSVCWNRNIPRVTEKSVSSDSFFWVQTCQMCSQGGASAWVGNGFVGSSEGLPEDLR